MALQQLQLTDLSYSGNAGQVLQSNGLGAAPSWVSLAYAVDYLIVAGGGGGGEIGRAHV